MNLAIISLIALFVAIVISCTTKINVGFIALVCAWIIGVYLGGMEVKAIRSGFPTDLFLTLTGVTLLFSQAQVNGTLERLTRHGVKGCRGNVGLMPLLFFAMALAIATVGAGNIAGAALVAPMAMVLAGRVGIPAIIMTIMVAHGALAGGVSPFAPTGIIVNNLMANMGLGGREWQTFFFNLLACAGMGLFGYLLFGGLRLFRKYYVEPAEASIEAESSKSSAAGPLEFKHWATIAVIAALLVGVIFFRVDVGMGAFAGAAILTLLRASDEVAAVKSMPWNVILMVCGVTVLTSLLEKTGGMELFSALLAKLATENTINGIIGFITGIVSMYSSTSGVVLPAFLPTVPGLVERLGGGEPLAISWSMIVAGHLVDGSPLSTIGAICVASAPANEDRRILFNKALYWGLSMAIAGAVICQIFFGMLW
ncbi:MAG: C4-dicarboxylate ABC transporter [Acidobacteria bacterium]|nr:C4-dicarboxylate ABC transporter [Acidobacteriota bacterium]